MSEHRGPKASVIKVLSRISAVIITAAAVTAILLYFHIQPPPPPPPPPRPPALVQSNFQSRDDSFSSNAVAFPHSVTTGNLIVVAISQYQGTVSGVRDDQSDTYTEITAQSANMSPDNDYVELYYGKNVKGGATTVTVAFSQTGDNNVGIYEFSGLDTASPLDHVTSSSHVGNDPDGGTLHTMMDNELIFVVGVDDNGNIDSANNVSPKPGIGYILLHHVDDYTIEKFYAEYRIAVHGSYHTDFTIAAAQADWAVIGASFKQTH